MKTFTVECTFNITLTNDDYPQKIIEATHAQIIKAESKEEVKEKMRAALLRAYRIDENQILAENFNYRIK